MIYRQYSVHVAISGVSLSSYLVSRLPYFTWVMVFVTLSAIVVQVKELETDFDRPDLNGTSVNTGKMEPVYIWVADLLFVLFTLVELTLKVRDSHT